MMSVNDEIESKVKAWIEREARVVPHEQVIPILKLGLQKVWDHARLTVSAVTLMAVSDRAVFNATKHHKFLSTLIIQKGGFSFEKFDSEQQITQRELLEGFQVLIARFITIIGKLTADVLTNDLCQELSKISYKANPRQKGKQS